MCITRTKYADSEGIIFFLVQGIFILKIFFKIISSQHNYVFRIQSCMIGTDMRQTTTEVKNTESD